MPYSLSSANKKALRALDRLERDCKKALNVYYATIESIQLNKKALDARQRSKQVGSWNNLWYLRTNDLNRGIGLL